MTSSFQLCSGLLRQSIQFLRSKWFTPPSTHSTLRTSS